MRPPGPYARFGPALRQVQRQTQTLAMTPQLRQAIQLLQLSNLELNAWLEGALETNPLLTRDEGGGENPPDREDEPRTDTADPAPLDFGGTEFAPAESLGETAAANLWDGDGDAGAGLGSWSGRGSGSGRGRSRRGHGLGRRGAARCSGWGAAGRTGAHGFVRTRINAGPPPWIRRGSLRSGAP